MKQDSDPGRSGGPQERLYTPYSKFKVGASLLLEGGHRCHRLQYRERQLRGDHLRRAGGNCKSHERESPGPESKPSRLFTDSETSGSSLRPLSAGHGRVLRPGNADPS